jgi:phosphoribosylformylglycinamidine cyclo-ligase
MRLDTVFDEFGHQRTLGEELLTPTKIYARDCLDLMKECDLRALAHVTGGGVPGNLVRVLPDNADAVVDRSTWRPQPIFELVRTKGRIEDLEMESTFNMGVGMIAIVAPADADRTLVIWAPNGDALVQEALVPLVVELGLDGDDAPDMLALTAGADRVAGLLDIAATPLRQVLA